MANLTEGFARKLVVPAGTSPKSGLQVFDDTLPGFGIRKFPNGKAVFFVKYRVGDQQRRLVLGSALVPGILAATRRKAAAILMKAKAGEDLVQETRAAEARERAEKEARRNLRTLGSLVPEYLEARRAKLRPRSYLEVDRHLSKQWAPLHDKDIKAITRTDVLGVIEELVDASGPRAADCARVSLTTFFTWALDHKDQYVDTNPAAGIKACAELQNKKVSGRCSSRISAISGE